MSGSGLLPCKRNRNPIPPVVNPCCNQVSIGVLLMGAVMRRRDFLKVITGSAAAVRSLTARAQQPIPAIGYLGANALDNTYTMPQIGAFRQGLKESGLVEERDLTILFQWGMVITIDCRRSQLSW
jgi:hypothetical protein